MTNALYFIKKNKFFVVSLTLSIFGAVSILLSLLYRRDEINAYGKGFKEGYTEGYEEGKSDGIALS